MDTRPLITTAKSISVIFHPAVMLLITFFVVVSSGTQGNHSSYWWTAYAAIYLILLCLFIAWGVRRKIFTNLDVSDRNQRRYLYYASAILSVIFTISLFILNAPQSILIITATILGLVGALSVVNRHIKASGHMACVAVFSTTLITLFGIVATPALLLLPLMAWSRVTLGRHTIVETCVGMAIGCGAVLAMVTLTH
jgi:heme exporter protein D